MSLVSVIVPIYNAQKYLDKCLESLLEQTLESIEIILVNDGSKDNSLQICKAYCAEHPNIKLIDKKNEGVSVARNTGIEHATGDYIGFVDPDDWVEPTMYENMYTTAINNNCNICMCNYFKDDKIGSSPKLFKFTDEVLTRAEIIEDVVPHMIGIDDIMPRYTYIMGSVWRCLYKKEFIAMHGLRFIKGISIMEDLLFSLEALLKSERVCFNHGVYYHYVQNPKSVLHAYNKNMWKDQVKVHELLEKILEAAEIEEDMRNRLDMRYISMALAAMRNEATRGNKAQLKKRVELIKAICTDDKLKIALDRVKPIQKPAILKGHRDNDSEDESSHEC